MILVDNGANILTTSQLVVYTVKVYTNFRGSPHMQSSTAYQKSSCAIKKKKRVHRELKDDVTWESDDENVAREHDDDDMGA